MVLISQHRQIINLSPTNSNTKKVFFTQTPSIYFGNKPATDSFSKTNYTVLEKNDSLFTQDLQSHLETFIKAVNNNTLQNNGTFKPIGKGYQGHVYLIPELNVAVKLSHTDKASKKCLMLNCDFEKETTILKHIPLEGTKNQKFIARLKLKDGNYALVTTYVKGKPLSSKPITNKQLESLLDEMFVLDKARILHCDLKNDNIMVDKDEVGIIDYGASFVFDQFVEPFNIKYDDDFYQCPSFSPPSNVRFFDFHSVLPHYFELRSKDSLEKASTFFVDYLKLRSNFHQKRADLFSEELKKNTQTNSLNNTQIKQLKESIEYETLQAKIFKNPSKKFERLELFKIYVDFISHKTLLAKFNDFKSLSIVSRKKTLNTINSYKNRINKMQSTQNLSSDEKRYLQYQTRYFDFYENQIVLPKFKNQMTECYGDNQLNEQLVDKIINQLSKYTPENLVINTKVVNNLFDRFFTFLKSDHKLKEKLLELIHID